MSTFKSKLKKWVVPVVALALFAGLAIAVMQKPQAPDVTFTTLTGEKISMQSLRGKTVLVNFWATDCPGCIKEMPDLINTYQQYKDKNLVVIAVAMPYDPPAQVANYTQEKALPFKVMHDGYGEMVKAFGEVNLTPTTFIFDAQGNRLQKTIGELNFTALRQLLDQKAS
ncbi:TlpA disulfide reductase family protein [Methylophilus medardicus]|uniref:TlpA family protein disulfide reductase n=1 Tax=Methylophilus medardicus TaxID=2588534 RepID=A0A5B8CTX8_9PROT|nr:TlpA disulfide reductase family protein [Methylophilus medardicus]QDC44751.1 TlpA family protein disulfide reductase [Methylophilus medardicus]QDC49758.1 TlpA family protein disulfide reductase [Methylophilus medardicus]QDC53463.1 TlpA family protein disulfide reductase [Methylophilus medardicus]